MAKMDIRQIREFLMAARRGPLGSNLSKGLLRLGIGSEKTGPVLERADPYVKGSAGSGIGGLAGAGGGIGSALMSTGNPYAMAAGAVLKLGAGAATAVSKIKEWGDHLHEQNRMFAQFSGSMASVIAVDEARRILLQREMGERRAESARNLANARFRLDQTMAPMEDAFANLKNNVLTKLTDMLNTAAKGLDNRLKEWGFIDEEGNTTAKGWASRQGHLWLGSIVDEFNEIEKRRPGRLR